MRKRTAIMTAIPLSVAGIVAASAYISGQFAATGTGASATKESIAVELYGVPSDFKPGDTATVTLHVNNPNPYPVRLDGLHFAVNGITGCPDGSFAVTNPSPGTVINAPHGESDPATTTLTFVDSSTQNQNQCFGKPITLTATGS